MLDKVKEFKPSSWAIDNKITIYLLTIFITIAGIMAYNSLPKENFPDITVPTIYVNTINGGNSPTNIENTMQGIKWRELRAACQTGGRSGGGCFRFTGAGAHEQDREPH